MADLKFYKDKEDAVFTLKRIGELVDLSRTLGVDADLLKRKELVVFVPADTINAIKTAIFKTGAHKNDVTVKEVITCVHSPKRPEDPK